MSEYLDAISRLEAPERPPMVKYIKRIPFMEYPQHDSEKDWNRIMAQGRNSRLPKYSISQRFYINKEDLGQYLYTFDLDKTFTTALGDRKSIAVREINFTDNSVSDGMKFFIKFTAYEDGAFYVDDDEILLDGDEKVYAANVNLKEYTIRKMKALLQVLSDGIIECFKKFFEKYGVDEDDLINSLTINDKSKTINIGLNHIRYDDTVMFNNFDFSIHFRGADNGTDECFFYDNDNWITRTITPDYVNDDKNKSCVLTYNFSNYMRSFGQLSSVCSTLNPYSIQNIIGNPDEYHDMLNKIYPFDRQNSFQLWFNDEDGNRLFNEHITGYLDLELIVDNSNNINLDV